MWYVALSFWVVAIVAHVFLFRSFPRGAFGVSRIVNLICGLVIALVCCDDGFTLGGFIAWCVVSSAFVPLFLSAKSKQIMTYGLIICMLLEVVAALFVCVARSLAPPIAALQVTGVLASNALLFNIEWLIQHPDIDVSDSSYFNMGP